METPTALRPRDAASGASAGVILSSCALAVTSAAAVLSPLHLGTSPLRWPAFALLVLSIPLACLLRTAADPARWWWTIVPVAWIGVIAFAAAALRNPDLHVEIFLLFPAVYCARQLSRNAAFTLIGTCAALVPVLATLHGDSRQELFLALFYAPALLGVAVRLTITGRRAEGMLAEIESRASTDALTGLRSRRMLELAVDGQRHTDQLGGQALLLIDIDNFKQINDEFGHPAGDAVLMQLSEVLRLNCRVGDLPCRIGGDELAILYRDMSRSDAQERADAIRTAVEQRFFALPGTTPIRVTVSLGVAHSADGRVRFAQLYDSADRALYCAKRAGRNAVALHEAA